MLRNVEHGLNAKVSGTFYGKLFCVAQPNPVSGSTYDSTVAYQANRLGWAVTRSDPVGRSVTVQADSLGRPGATRGRYTSGNRSLLAVTGRIVIAFVTELCIVLNYCTRQGVFAGEWRTSKPTRKHARSIT